MEQTRDKTYHDMLFDLKLLPTAIEKIAALEKANAALKEALAAAESKVRGLEIDREGDHPKSFDKAPSPEVPSLKPVGDLPWLALTDEVEHWTDAACGSFDGALGCAQYTPGKTCEIYVRVARVTSKTVHTVEGLQSFPKDG